MTDYRRPTTNDRRPMKRWTLIVLVSVGWLVAGCGGWNPFLPPPTPTPQPTLPPPTATVAPTLAPSPTSAPSATTAPPTATPRPPTATAPPVATGQATPNPGLPVPPGAVAGGRSMGDPKSPELGNTGYDVEQYTLQLTLDAPGRRLAGSAIIEATSTLDRLGQLSLDLVDGFELRSVTVNGAAVQTAYRDNKLTLNLPQPLRQGDRFTLKIDYSGPIRPIPSRFVQFAEVGLQVPRDGTIFAISEPDGARAWFPANDHPLDKARFRFEITVQPPLIVAANGVLVETKAMPDGVQYTWEMRQPMAPYLATVMAAPYDRLEGRSPQGIPLRHYVYSNRRADLERLFANTGAALDWFSAKLGPYPYDEFGYATVSLRGASLETQSIVLLSDQMLNEGVLVHEMSHMWFGDLVSLSSWADIWRNEGFATYFTTLWERRNDPPEALASAMNDIETGLVEHQTDYPLGNPPPRELFAPDSYQKGAWVAHMLHRQIGDEAFFNGLRLYFERYKNRTASRAEFEAVFNEVSGQDLTPFFQRWLDQAGLPTLDVNWDVQRTDGVYSLDVQVCQVNGLTYPTDFEVVATGDGGSQTLSVPLRGGKDTRVRVTLPFAPQGLASDPDERVLAREAVQQVQTLSPCP
ncbi:MAG: M1 family metallopeptidase [Anaerolineae bacterium]|nr:M1 family metallopeptidase [Anaerolineae bacterium]